jgi:hypothetical protein
MIDNQSPLNVKKRIRYFSDFCTSLQCKEKVEYICNSKCVDGYKTEFEIVVDENYTHAILLNTAMPSLRIPRENVIGLAFEPPRFLNLTNTFIEYAIQHISIYYIGEKGNLPSPFQSGFAYMWHILPNTWSMDRSIQTKPKPCSIMVSEKKTTQGHRYRHQLVESILSTNLPIDIYGRGCKFYAKKGKNGKIDNRLRGEFEEMDSIMYSDYMFHIAIENFSHPDYLSEKILNPLLCGTTPIYWGSLNIDNYFPNSSYKLTGNITKDMFAIQTMLREPHKFVKQIDIVAIEEKTNILKNMGKLFIK